MVLPAICEWLAGDVSDWADCWRGLQNCLMVFYRSYYAFWGLQLFAGGLHRDFGDGFVMGLDSRYQSQASKTSIHSGKTLDLLFVLWFLCWFLPHVFLFVAPSKTSNNGNSVAIRSIWENFELKIAILVAICDVLDNRYYMSMEHFANLNPEVCGYLQNFANIKW